MKSLFAMLFLAGSLNWGLGETVPPTQSIPPGRNPDSPRRQPMYLGLGSLGLLAMLAWRARQQAGR